MKKVILAMALVSGLSFANAQNNSPASTGSAMNAQSRNNMSPADRATHETDKATKKLGLSADQQTKWKEACLARINANEPIREKMKGSTTPQERDQVRGQMKGNNDKFEATINGILTSDQKAKYDQMKSERHGMHGGKHGKMNHPDNGNPPSGQ